MPDLSKFPVNPRENILKFLHHESTKMIPNFLLSVSSFGVGIGGPGPVFEGGPVGGGCDGFGSKWLAPSSGGGAPMVDTTKIVLDDIEDWRTVPIPDVNTYDWASDAARDLAAVNRDLQIVDYCLGYGPFMRLTYLMGFENALISMITNPEDINDFFTVLIDHKIAMLDKVIEYYHPDTITFGDDIATQRSLFMSPDTYRKLIKPHHKRFVKACLDRGVIPIYHLCGLADNIIEDIIDCGWAAWTGIQPINDICGMIEKYGDRIGFIGGYDSNGKPALESATPEEIQAEIRRCYDTYGKYGKGYAFFGYRVINSPDPSDVAKAMGAIAQYSIQYGLQSMTP